MRSQIASRDNKKGFTLIELLVVISIIAILASLLLPALARAREKALKTSCMHRLKNLSTFQSFYADSYNEYFPANSGSGLSDFYAPVGQELRQMLKTFNRSNGYFSCPSAPYLDRIPFKSSGATWWETGGTSYQMPAGYYYTNSSLISSSYFYGWQIRFYLRYPTIPIPADGGAPGSVIVNRKFRTSDTPSTQPTALDANQPQIGIWRPYGGSTANFVTKNGYTGLESNHRDGANIIFLDGHAVWRNNKEIQYRIGTNDLRYRIFW